MKLMSKENVYQDFIAISRYARYNDVEQRREGWAESVKRYFDFMQEHLEENCSYKLKKSLRAELESAVLSREVMPSMRALATAGPALDRCNVAAVWHWCWLFCRTPVHQISPPDIRAF